MIQKQKNIQDGLKESVDKIDDRIVEKQEDQFDEKITEQPNDLIEEKFVITFNYLTL